MSVFDDRLALGAAAPLTTRITRFDNAFTYRAAGELSLRQRLSVRTRRPAPASRRPAIYELYGFHARPGLLHRQSQSEAREIAKDGKRVSIRRFSAARRSSASPISTARLKDEIVVDISAAEFRGLPENATSRFAARRHRDSAFARIGERMAHRCGLHLSACVRERPSGGAAAAAYRERQSSPGAACDDRFGANLTVRYNGEQEGLRISRCPARRGERCRATLWSISAPITGSTTCGRSTAASKTCSTRDTRRSTLSAPQAWPSTRACAPICNEAALAFLARLVALASSGAAGCPRRQSRSG